MLRHVVEGLVLAALLGAVIVTVIERPGESHAVGTDGVIHWLASPETYVSVVEHTTVWCSICVALTTLLRLHPIPTQSTYVRPALCFVSVGAMTLGFRELVCLREVVWPGTTIDLRVVTVVVVTSTAVMFTHAMNAAAAEAAERKRSAEMKLEELEVRGRWDGSLE